MALKQFEGAPASVAFWRRTAYLIVASEYHDRCPMELIDDVLNFDTHFRIGAHPIDFLAERREAVKVVLFAIKIEEDRHDIGLIKQRAGTPANVGASEDLPALRDAQLVDDHGP